MATAPKKKQLRSDLIPTRTSRLHNKSAVAVGAAVAKLFTVLVTCRKPEQFAAVLLSDDDTSIMVRRKKGYGSSKVLEVMISKSDVLEITGAGVGHEAIIRAVGQVPELKLAHQKVKNVAGWIICTDAETGEQTRINTRAQGVEVSVVGEDVKEGSGKAAPKTDKKTGNVSKLPTRKQREV